MLLLGLDLSAAGAHPADRQRKATVRGARHAPVIGRGRPVGYSGPMIKITRDVQLSCIVCSVVAAACIGGGGGGGNDCRQAGSECRDGFECMDNGTDWECLPTTAGDGDGDDDYSGPSGGGTGATGGGTGATGGGTGATGGGTGATGGGTGATGGGTGATGGGSGGSSGGSGGATGTGGTPVRLDHPCDGMGPTAFTQEGSPCGRSPIAPAACTEKLGGYNYGCDSDTCTWELGNPCECCCPGEICTSACPREGASCGACNLCGE